MKSLFRIASLVLAMVSLSFASHANQRHHALIVGVGEYSKASESSRLPGVQRDMATARSMAMAMGVEQGQIVELRDTQATHANIIAALEKLKAQVGPGERVFIYFSGHGTSYSTPQGCEQGFIPYTAGRHTINDVLSEATIASYTSKISEKADKAIVMFDACYSGGLVGSRTRSLAETDLIRPKFSARSGDQCGVAVNQPSTRSFVPTLQRLGVPEQNFVQITAAKHNEVSWDNEQHGGLATYSLGQCLLGGARDLNASGAITLEEVRVCAQAKLDAMMAPHKAAGLLPSTIQVRGVRNLIVQAAPVQPVSTALAQAPASPAPPPAPATPVATPVVVPVAPPVVVAVAPPVVVPVAPPVSTTTGMAATTATSVAATPATPPLAPPPPQAVAPAPQADSPPALLASSATLQEIFDQRNGRFKLQVASPKQLTIGKDPFNFTVKSNLEGYLYVMMLGSDEKSFYLLFPNKLDQSNKIKANADYKFPRPGWSVKAGGPAGTNQLLFVVSPSARDPKIFVPAEQGGGGTFTYSVADLSARKRLIDFFVGRGVQGRNGNMAAALIKVDEVP